MKTITIKNVLNDDCFTYMNNLSLTDTIISHIMQHEQKLSSQLHNDVMRDKIKKEIKIDEFYSSVDNKTVAFCEFYNLYARPIN